MEKLINNAGSFILITVVIIIPAAFLIGLAIGRRAQNNLRKNKPDRLRDILYLENKVSTLNSKVNDLNELNTRYLNFSQDLSEVVKRIYYSLSFSEITTTIISLIKDMVNTDIIEMYILDSDEKILRKVDKRGEIPDKGDAFMIGEGIIGQAGQDGIIKTRGSNYKENGAGETRGKNKINIWIASPIHFKNRILGVIGIGKIKNPVGNERIILKMISDIAGVAIINQKHLKRWKDGSITDPLTGLYNRRYFFYMMSIYSEKSILENTPVSICLFDIDHFKHYNDTNGHQKGDVLLKEISDLLVKLSRKESVIARYGGEEFIIMIPRITKEEAFVYANRVQEETAKYPFFNREKQPMGFISISGGVASFPNDSTTIEKVINLADKALYKAKKEGRNRMIIHKPFMFSDKHTEF